MKVMNFENWCTCELLKIGHHFSNKVIQKSLLSKTVNNKKYALKLIFFHEKKSRKIPMIWQFLTTPYYTNSPNSITFFGYVEF